MLDPNQTSILLQARGRPVRVTGFPGSGMSTLARAIADDAAARGLSCLLVGASPELDRHSGGPSFPPPLNPVLARRAQGPVAPKRAVALRPEGDVLALRASQDPHAARTALRLYDRARELVERHGLVADEVEIAGRVGAGTDPRLLAVLRLTAVDAMTYAAAVWSDAGAPSLGEVASVLAGGGPARPPETPYAHLVVGGPPAAVEDFLARLAREGAGNAAGVELAELRRALDPWAWRGALRDVRDAHAWAGAQASLIEGVEGFVRSSGGVGPALAASGSRAEARTLRALVERVPGRGDDQILATCSRLAAEHRAHARRLEPFLARHGSRDLAGLRDMPANLPSLDATGGLSIGEVAHRLRSAAHAMGRLGPALSYMEASLPERAWHGILARPLSELASATDIAFQESERFEAARTLLEIREAFSASGFGDVLAAGDLRARLSAGDAPGGPAPAATRSSSPDFLDLLLPDAGDGEATPHVPGGRLVRAVDAESAASAGGHFDVVVVDDETSAPDGLVGHVSDLSHRVHFTGVSTDDADALRLGHPHRQRDVVLANVAAGRVGEPYWLGSPKGAGVVVRPLDGGQVPDLGAAAGRMVGALRDAGYDACVVGERPEADIVVAHADVADGELVRAACNAGRDGVVVLCRESRWEAPDLVSGGDDAGMGRLGWRLVADVAEGRIFVRDGRSAVLVREPAWDEMSPDNVAERVARLRALGWRPVVDWQGTERSPEELARVFYESAATPDPRLRLLMKGHPLG